MGDQGSKVDPKLGGHPLPTEHEIRCDWGLTKLRGTAQGVQEARLTGKQAALKVLEVTRGEAGGEASWEIQPCGHSIPSGEFLK